VFSGSRIEDLGVHGHQDSTAALHCEDHESHWSFVRVAGSRVACARVELMHNSENHP
jgi:hypothetical protein